MKKILLILLFFPLISIASNWIFVSEDIVHNKFYIDTSSIIKNGNEVTFWWRINFANRESNGALSAKNQDVVNCITRETSAKFIMVYSDWDNLGSLISSNKYSLN